MTKYLVVAIILVGSLFISCSSIENTFIGVKDKAENEFSFTKEQVESLNIGIVQGIYCGSNPNGPGAYIFTFIQPTNAEANTVYTVSLYEEGKLRQRNTVSWNQPEINIQKVKSVSFNASGEEFTAYWPEYALPFFSQGKSLSNIFSVTIMSEASISQLSYRSFKLTNFYISPHIVSVNQPITIKCDVVNMDNDAGEYAVILKINGQVEKTIKATVCGKCTYPIEFIVARGEVGSYTLDISGQFEGNEVTPCQDIFVVK